MRRGILFLSLLLQHLFPGAASAQYSYFDHPSTFENRISKLLPMLGGTPWFANTLIYAPAPEQVWDSVSRHYRGTAVSSLRYSELAAAGIRSFRLSNNQDVDRYGSATREVNDRLPFETEAFFSSDQQRTKRHFYFDDSGWLRAIVTTSINPEYEAYTEKRDSLHYSLAVDGSGSCVWSSREVSTGSGYAGRTGCPEMPSFHRIVRDHQERIEFDAWQNITAAESRAEELWDTCRGDGLQVRKLRVSYDSIGRATGFEEQLGNGTPPGFTVVNRYEELPYAELEARTHRSYVYAPLREASIRNWLLSQGKLTAVMLYRTETRTRYYDSKSNREVQRPDSPYIRTDTSLYVINASKQRIVSRKHGEREPFELYMRWKRPGGGGSDLLLQQVPVPPDPAAGPATVCDPLALSGGQVYRTERLLLGSDTLFRISVSDAKPPTVYSGYYDRYENVRAPAFRFSTELPATSSAQSRSMMLRDARGLTRYIWNQSDIYQLSYFTNEPD